MKFYSAKEALVIGFSTGLIAGMIVAFSSCSVPQPTYDTPQVQVK